MTLLIATVGLVSVLSATAVAAWSVSGSGDAAAAAASVPAGNTPSAVASGSSVTVTWPAATLSSGGSLEGYVLARENVATKAVVSAEANCSGTITKTTCTELNVPAGTWTYTDTPVQLKWKGTASPASNSVTVE